jgi:hypothetical protein
MVKKYDCIPRSFLVINVCNQGQTLRSPCRFNKMRTLWEYYRRKQGWEMNDVEGPQIYLFKSKTVLHSAKHCR